MAQSTGSMSGVDIAVSVSTGGTVFTDISGSTTGISVSGFSRQSGETYTFDGDHAIVKGGKREPVEIEVSIVYTETATEAFTMAWTEFDTDDGDPFWVRWVPVTGGSTWTSDTGVLVACLPPSGEAAPGDPVVGAFTVKCGQVNVT